MKTAIIGHRGVGKSALAKRLKIYFENTDRKVLVFDLDDEISIKYRKSIKDLFTDIGEPAFRNIERECFQQLNADFSHSNYSDLFIIAGAGFLPTQDFGFRFLWIQRPTDSFGRIFPDRPRLDSSQSSLDEYHERFAERETRFFDLQNSTLILTEGFDFANPAEEAFFKSTIRNLGGAFTIYAHHLLQLEELLSWGVEYFELRDDLLTSPQIEDALKKISHHQIILSFRDPNQKSTSIELVKKDSLKFDWPVAYPACDWASPFIISAHNEELTVAIEQLKKASELHPNSLLKMAVEVEEFEGLKLGHKWQQSHPNTRVFLPISKEAKWKWYRLWTQKSQRLQFFKIDRYSLGDQPSLLERLRQNAFTAHAKFAAVLGNPIAHSRSPGQHFDFFKAYDMPFYAIQISEHEFETALDFLKNRGLVAAAITSPLKNAAGSLLGQSKSAINTLFIVNDLESRFTNTDQEALLELKKLLRHEDPSDIVIWGGGGTLKSLQNIFKSAVEYSSRSGKPRGANTANEPKTIVWAVGRKHFDQNGKFPDSHWPINLVIDLNYSEDSPGRDCALRYGCAYVSGLEMFKAQALAQQKFWKNLLPKSNP